MFFIFCTFCLQWLGFDLAPARVITGSISDLVVTSQDYIKVEHVRTWLLSSSLAKFQQFLSECFFKFCLVYFLFFMKSFFNWRFQAPCVPLFFLKDGEYYSCSLFFVWNLQTVFPLKPMFSKCSSFFGQFCNDGALNLHLHVVALSVSVTMSWPAKTT